MPTKTSHAATLAVAKRAIADSGLYEHRDIDAELDPHLAPASGAPTLSMFASPPRVEPDLTTRSRDWLWNAAIRVLTEAGLKLGEETYDTDGRPSVTIGDVVVDDGAVIVFTGRVAGTGFDGEPCVVPGEVVETLTWAEFVQRTTAPMN